MDRKSGVSQRTVKSDGRVRGIFIMNKTPQRLGRGERAPDFVLPYGDGTPTRFYSRAGESPTLLFFYDADEEERVLHLAEEIRDNQPGLFDIFGVKRKDSELEDSKPGGTVPFPVFLDSEESLRAAYRLAVDERSAVFLLDPNLRVLASLSPGTEEGTFERVLSILETSLPEVASAEVKMQAPILLIPNVLDSEICSFLVQVWEKKGNVETGVEQSRGEEREEAIDHDNKRRRDHVVQDGELLRRLTTTIGRRVMPEVQRAFAYRATRFEGFKIACYEAAAGGMFHAHRDNLSPSTAHRRFALTLNLNQGYEGGYLKFPEFGPHLYRPDLGEAIVFSCSHLHEVTQVTANRRLALLSFLFSEGDTK